ncbi:hypothetical protein ACFQL7_28630 [Halocatena marina]|uniref:Secreted protein n=2 Tax=Halocatena marina TaxID=2934937 RepID=A0ABD5YVP7_9EURY|nr:hypothetical protein [Halocatena marina]
MSRKIQISLTAMLILALVGGGFGAAAAKQCDTDDGGNTTVINDDDVVDVDNALNDINSNVLGITNQDSPVDIASS